MGYLAFEAGLASLAGFSEDFLSEADLPPRQVLFGLTSFIVVLHSCATSIADKSKYAIANVLESEFNPHMLSTFSMIKMT